jgi:hypothetical protein
LAWLGLTGLPGWLGVIALASATWAKRSPFQKCLAKGDEEKVAMKILREKKLQ